MIKLAKIYVFVAIQYLLPKGWLSRLFGALGQCRISWIKNAFIKGFIAYFDVDMSEAQESDPTAYPHFNAFFTRALKPHCRPIMLSDQQVLVSPADGTISAWGAITSGHCIQAKKITYSVDTLLANTHYTPQHTTSAVKDFQEGHFMTVYLAPHNYHRVHAPFAGTLQSIHYIPGSLFSVNTITTEKVRHLFLRNERVILYIETTLGPIAVILVGACLVGSIHTPWTGAITPALRSWLPSYNGCNFRHPHPQQPPLLTTLPYSLQVGEEIGHFQMGSTVIVLLSNGLKPQWQAAVKEKISPLITMGTAIASLSNKQEV
ncbi:MAG: archaetidylserine decarboxylase [Gammaproteobacteria bacterium]